MMEEDFPPIVELHDFAPLPPPVHDDLPLPVVLELPPPAPIPNTHRRKRARRTTISPSRRLCKHCTKACAASLTDRGRTYLSSLRADCYTAHREDNELKAIWEHAWTCLGAMHAQIMHACTHARMHACMYIHVHTFSRPRH